MTTTSPDPASISYQPTLDDHVAVSTLLGCASLNLWRILIARAILYVVIGGGLVLLFDKISEPPFATIYTIAMTGAFIWSGVNVFRLPGKIQNNFQRQLAAKKNIGFAVPTTVTLHSGYLEIASTLERTQIAWDVIEGIKRSDGFLLFAYGLANIFIPERAFANEEACVAFLKTAQALHQDVLSRPGDLTISRWPSQQQQQ